MKAKRIVSIQGNPEPLDVTIRPTDTFKVTFLPGQDGASHTFLSKVDGWSMMLPPSKSVYVEFRYDEIPTGRFFDYIVGEFDL